MKELESMADVKSLLHLDLPRVLSLSVDVDNTTS